MTRDYLPDIAQTVREAVQLRRKGIAQLCSRLVEAVSINPPGDTRLVADVVQRELYVWGISSRLEAAMESMPCVVAEIDSGKPGLHLILNVHLDTMPPGDLDTWSVDPYSLTKKNGRWYGLGMGNMKGSVAAMTHALAILNELRHQWNGKVTFTAVSDEVVFGPNGAAHLLDTIDGLAGDALICGEGPGFQRLSIAEKGVLWLAIDVTGEAGHSSSVKPMASASARLAHIIAGIDSMTGRRSTPPPDIAEFFDPDDAGFELSCNVGTVRAGSFVGQVATTGSAEVDCRVPPGMTIDEVENEIRSLCSEIPGTSVRRIKGWDPNWTSPRSAIGQAWAGAETALGEAPADFAIRLPASDASRWRALGTPALCFGPQPTLSAGVDDYATEKEVIRCTELFAVCALSLLTNLAEIRESNTEPTNSEA